MAWVKIDDGFVSHPKAQAAGPLGRELFIAGLCWCATHLTDGKIPKTVVPLLAATAGVKSGLARTLVDVGLWHDRGDHYSVHDFLDYNEPAAAVRARREARSEAGRLGGKRSGEARKRSKESSNGEALASSSVEPRPDPTRPKALHLSDRQTARATASGSVGPSGTIEEALGIHAQIAYANADPAGIRNRIRWLAGVAAIAASEHGPALEEYLRDHPQTSSVDLAKAVFGHDDFDLARITHQEHHTA